MTDSDSPDEPTRPDLRKPVPEPTYDPPAASIWETLDGSAPPAPQPRFDPASPTAAWGRPHQGPPAPHQVAAAYSAASATGPAPTGVFTLASWGRRLGAFLIDALLFGTVAVLATIPIGMAAGLTVEETVGFFGMVSGPPESAADPAPLYAALVIQRLIVGTIPALFLSRWNGQTPGKRALGLRVMRADGGEMSLKVALKRELLGRTVIFDGLALITLGLATFLNYLWPLWDPQRRAGHDFIGGTRVVRLPPTPPGS